MTARITARALAALASAAFVIAACGNGAATTAGPTSAATTQNAATQAPATQAAGATDGLGSFVIPSFHGDANLEDLFPDQIGGETVEVQSMTGAQFAVTGMSSSIDAVLAKLGKSTADLSVAFGGVGDVTIIAFKITGVPASAIQTAAFDVFQQDTPSTISDVTIGGKTVKKITPTDATEDATYLYGVQDVIFTVGGSDLSDALLTEVFSKLP